MFVYDTTQKVPLIFSHPNLVPHKKVLEDQVRLVDVAPTILDLIKIRRPKTFQGISLKNLLQGKPLPEALVAYAESLYANKHYKWSSLLAYRTQEWKYIHSTRPELFNIKEDPGELENLATTRSDTMSTVASLLPGTSRRQMVSPLCVATISSTVAESTRARRPAPGPSGSASATGPAAPGM